MIRRQRRIIVGAFILFNAIAVLILFQIDRRYTATALVVVDSTESQLLGIETEIQSQPQIDNFIDTEVEIAASSNVAQRVLSRIDLTDFPEFRLSISLADRLSALVSPSGETDNTQPTAYMRMTEEQKRRLVDRYHDTMHVTRRRLTSIIAFSATSQSPRNAALLANTAAEAYLDEQIEAKLGITQRVALYLRERVKQLGTDIQEGETDISRFVREKTTNIGPPEVRAQIAKLRERLAEEERRRAASAGISALLAGIGDGPMDTVLRQIENDELRRLAAERKAFERRLDDSPAPDETLAGYRNRIAELDGLIDTIVKREQEAIDARIEESLARTTVLHAELQSAVAEQDIPTGITVELFRLQRNVAATRELYDTFLGRLRQVEQQRNLSLPDSRIVARAIVPVEPSYPPRMLILIASVLGGLGLGLGLALLRDLYIGGFMTVEQIESVIGVPVLTVMPRTVELNEHGAISPDRLISEKPLSAFAESTRRLRIGLDAASPDGVAHAIVVTSTEPREGKSTTALALGRSYALAGKRALLIDADLRHPFVHKWVGHAADGGLGDFLSGPFDSDVFRRIIKRERDTNLDMILSSGPSGVATDTLVGSDRFERLMKAAREWYDVIVIDTPPIGLVVDARVLAQQADSVVYVVRWASTSQRNVRMSIRELSSMPGKHLVIALNHIDQGSAYQTSHRYGSYYR